MKQFCLHLVVILAACAAVFFTNLGGPKLWDRDEPRNAGCTAEMLQRHDWVTPYFNGELRTHKPILTYWLMMSAYTTFGQNEFAARFWSALLGTGTVLCCYAIGRRLFCVEVGLWAALALCTAAMFVVASRAATPDGPLIFFSVLALTIYVHGTFRAKDPGAKPLSPPELKAAGIYFPQSWLLVALMYACMGLGVLAKGPVGLILPTAVIGMFLLLMRLPEDKRSPVKARSPWTMLHWSLGVAGFALLLALDHFIGPLKTFALFAGALVAYGLGRPESLAADWIRPFAPRHFFTACWAMRPLTAIIVVLAVAAPWYVWVGLRTDGEWVRDFFWNHNFNRATTVFEGHSGVFVFYPATIFGSFFPWSILIIPTTIGVVARIRRGDPWRMSYIFAACWIGVYMGLFSLSSTKLPSYITPCYPAIALLIGAFVFDWRRSAQVAGRWWPRLAFGTLAAAGVAMMIALPIVAGILLPGDEWLGVVGVIPLAGAVGCLVLSRRNMPERASLLFATTSVLLMTAAFGFVAERVSRHQHIHELIAAVRTSSDAPHLAAWGKHEPSWVYYFGGPVKFLAGDATSVGNYFRRDPDAFVLVPSKLLPQLETHLPKDVHELARTRFFLKKYDLVAVGRTRDEVRIAHEHTVRKLQSR